MSIDSKILAVEAELSRVRERLARTLQALRKIDAVTVDSAHFTHSGMQHAAVEQVNDALEDVRDLIGPAPAAASAGDPFPPDTRTKAEKQRAAQVRDIGSYAELTRRLK